MIMTIIIDMVDWGNLVLAYNNDGCKRKTIDMADMIRGKAVKITQKAVKLTQWVKWWIIKGNVTDY